MSLMWMPAQTTEPPLTSTRRAAGTSAPTGAKRIAASSVSGGRLIGAAGPDGPELAREGLGLAVAGASESVDAFPLAGRHLRDDVRAGAETVKPEPVHMISCQSIGAMADQPGAE